MFLPFPSQGPDGELISRLPVEAVRQGDSLPLCCWGGCQQGLVGSGPAVPRLIHSFIHKRVLQKNSLMHKKQTYDYQRGTKEEG